MADTDPGGTPRPGRRNRAMSAPDERTVALPGGTCRVWERGAGEPVVVFAGLGGFPRWTPFLDVLAETRRVVVPSLPGFPGGSLVHKQLDEMIDWVTAGLDLLDAAGLARADWVGLSIGGLLAAELAAVAPERVGRLVLVGPFGLQDEGEPTADPYGVKTTALPELITRDAAAYASRFEVPDEEDAQEWFVTLTRAHEAAARLLWPTGDRGLRKRLHRIRAETLLVWGSDDRIIPPSYAKRFADGIAGPCRVRSIEGSGHLPDLDAPEQLAASIRDFLQR